MLLVADGINTMLISTSMRRWHCHFRSMGLESLFTSIDSIHLMCLAILLIERLLAVTSGMALGKGLVIRVHCLVSKSLRWNIGIRRVVLEAVLATLSSAVADVEEATCSNTETDDYEG